MAEKCGVKDSIYGLTCDRPAGHDGNHRGYNLSIDEPMFWQATAGPEVDAIFERVNRHQVALSVSEDEPMAPGVSEPDALVWAKSLVAHVRWKSSIATDEMTLVGWFATAMCAAVMQERSKASVEQAELRRDFDALLAHWTPIAAKPFAAVTMHDFIAVRGLVLALFERHPGNPRPGSPLHG